MNNNAKTNKMAAKIVMFGTMDNGRFDFIQDMSDEEKEKRIREDIERRHLLYGSISEVRMGSMRFALIPADLLIPNDKYQRVYTIDYKKVDELASKWNDELVGVITVAAIPGTEMFEVIDGWHRVCAAKLCGVTHLAARLIDLPEDEEERIKAAADIFVGQGVDPLSKADMFNAQVRRGKREYVIINNAIKGKKYLIDRHIIDNTFDEEKRKEYKAEWCVITGLSGLLEAACTDAGEIVVPQVLSILERANWRTKRMGYGGEIIRTIYKILNLHDNDPVYAEAISQYLVNYEPQDFQANARSEYPLRRRLERQMMLLEREVSKSLGIEPVYIGGNLVLYHK